MTERRFALIIANNEYRDPGLKKLVAPAQDAKELAEVLKDPAIGGFEVKSIVNQTSYDVSKEIESFFTSDHDRNDLLLLYFSCHGIKDDYGRLYFATVNTFRNTILSTSVPADFVNQVMERSHSRKQVLVLDCCYSGAFARGMRTKADKQIHTNEKFGGRGRVVMTASDSTQYSFEGDNVEGENINSVFTNALVQGLSTGAADLDRNGHIDYVELYDYVYKTVKDKTPQQSPRKWEFDLEGEKIIIAQNPKLISKDVMVPERNAPPDYTAMISEALEHYANEDYTSALTYLDKALMINPKSAKAYYFKGSSFGKLNKYKEAIDCYENALKIDPKYEAAVSNLLRTVRTYMSYKERGAEEKAQSIKKDIQKDIDATNSNLQPNNTQIEITKVFPLEVQRGANFSIFGSNFGVDRQDVWLGTRRVGFDDREHLLGWSDGRIDMKMPVDLPPANDYQIMVVRDGSFEVAPTKIIIQDEHDTSPPAVVNTSPNDGAKDIPVDSPVIAIFSEPMSSLSISSNTFTVKKAGETNALSGSVSLTSDRKTARFDAAAHFAPYTKYIATINKSAKDIAGNSLVETKVWSFTTAV